AHEWVQTAELDEAVGRITDALLSGGPAAMHAAKELIRLVENQPVEDLLVEATAQRIADLRATPEAREGLEAFLSERPVSWAVRYRNQHVYQNPHRQSRRDRLPHYPHRPPTGYSNGRRLFGSRRRSAACAAGRRGRADRSGGSP